MLCVDERLPSKLIAIHINIETLVVDVQCVPSITVCLTYKRPSASGTEVLELLSVIKEVAGKGNIVILGDFNFADVNWLTLTADSPLSTQFCDVLFDHNLAQLVLHPTHVKGNILDLVITDMEDSIVSLWTVDCSGISDHNQIFFSVTASKPKVRPMCKKADYVEMCSFLLD